MRTLALIMAMWPVVALGQFENPAIVGAMTYGTAAPATWAPTNAYGWWHADSMTANNGDPVTHWPDSAAVPHDLWVYGANSTNAPVFTNSSTPSSLPAVLWINQTPAKSLTNAFGSTLAQPLTWFLVLNLNKQVGKSPKIMDAISASPREMIELGSASGNPWGYYAGTEWFCTNAVTSPNGFWVVLTVCFNNTTSFMRTNGVLLTDLASNPGTAGSSGFTLGSRYALDANTSPSGLISEVILYNGSVATNDMIWVENNLKTKYGF